MGSHPGPSAQERLAGGLLNSSRILLVWRRTRAARPAPDKSKQGETTGSDDDGAAVGEAPPVLFGQTGRADLPEPAEGRALCQGAHARGSSNVGRQ